MANSGAGEGEDVREVKQNEKHTTLFSSGYNQNSKTLTMGVTSNAVKLDTEGKDREKWALCVCVEDS